MGDSCKLPVPRWETNWYTGALELVIYSQTRENPRTGVVERRPKGYPFRIVLESYPPLEL